MGQELVSHNEVILIFVRKTIKNIVLTVGEPGIVSQITNKYLGITIDVTISFKQHLVIVSDKAAKVGASLSWLMRNICGSTHKRTLFVSHIAYVVRDPNICRCNVVENLLTKVKDHIQAKCTKSCVSLPNSIGRDDVHYRSHAAHWLMKMKYVWEQKRKPNDNT